MMMRSLKSELFKTDSVHNFLWNTTDPILDTSQKIAPFFVPSKNVGILHRVFHHSAGEIWKLTSSPTDASKISTCYNSLVGENSCTMKSAILKLPENENHDTIENLEIVTKLDTSSFGNDIKTTEFHPTDANTAVTLTDSHVVLWDISETEGRAVSNIALEGKNNPKFTNGKWNPHQNCNQVL